MGIIIAIIFVSNQQFSYSQIHTCDKPFTDILLPKWLDEVRICFVDQDKIFAIDEKVPIHMYAETTESAEWIRIHFFHSSQTGYFEPDGIERQKVIEARKKESPHIINLQDNERIFGTDLDDATNFVIQCNDPPCHMPYEKERTFEFSFPGTYYYEITMQTPDAENIYSHYPGIEVFKVLNFDEQLEMEANEAIVAKESEPVIHTEEKQSDDSDIVTLIAFFGSIASIIGISLHFRKEIQEKLIHKATRKPFTKEEELFVQKSAHFRHTLEYELSHFMSSLLVYLQINSEDEKIFFDENGREKAHKILEGFIQDKEKMYEKICKLELRNLIKIYHDYDLLRRGIEDAKRFPHSEFFPEEQDAFLKLNDRILEVSGSTIDIEKLLKILQIPSNDYDSSFNDLIKQYKQLVSLPQNLGIYVLNIQVLTRAVINLDKILLSIRKKFGSIAFKDTYDQDSA